MAKQRKRRSKLTKVVTANQSQAFVYGNGALTSRPSYAQTGTLTELRAVRKDPTGSLVRQLLVSSIQAGSWSIEGDEDVPEEVIEFMQHVLLLRNNLIYNAVSFGQVDYGWMPFEKIFVVDDNSKLVIDSLKPLLHDITTVLVTPQGKFDGYRQRPLSGLPVDLDARKALHIAFNVEAGNLYGVPLLEAIRATSDAWIESNAGAKRYDEKLAGSLKVLHVPPGTSVVEGESLGNDEVAVQVVAAMESSDIIAMPTTTADVLQQVTDKAVADLYAWKIEVLDHKGKQASFNERLNYLDKLKVRGMGLPERSILEGQNGTKAEAGTHGEWALLNLEATDRSIVAMLNVQLIDQLVELNYGPNYKGKVRVVAQPLVDTQLEFLRKLYLDIQDQNLDVEKLAGRLDLPQTEDGNLLPKKEEDENDEE